MDPTIVQRAPFLEELGPGDYLWCACGRSANQPWCDGAHKDTGLSPIRFTIGPRKTPETVWLCGCKHSRRKPFCDGTHNKLPVAAGIP
jgi:CDGSH-type Zn-finger protein